MDSTEVFTQFVEAINHHDVKALAALMTDDHIFVDSLGNQVKGAALMQAGWTGYFAMCPGYWIRTHDVIANANIVLATGEAGGTIKGTSWRTPAAWKAVIRDGAVMEWRVFADNKPVYDILSKAQA